MFGVVVYSKSLLLDCRIKALLVRPQNRRSPDLSPDPSPPVVRSHAKSPGFWSPQEWYTWRFASRSTRSMVVCVYRRSMAVRHKEVEDVLTNLCCFWLQNPPETNTLWPVNWPNRKRSKFPRVKYVTVCWKKSTWLLDHTKTVNALFSVVKTWFKTLKVNLHSAFWAFIISPAASSLGYLHPNEDVVPWGMHTWRWKTKLQMQTWTDLEVDCDPWCICVEKYTKGPKLCPDSLFLSSKIPRTALTHLQDLALQEAQIESD